MLTKYPSEEVRAEIRRRELDLLNLAGAPLEMVERVMARKEMDVNDLLEFREALVELKRMSLD